jgi:outer membrane protein assembly factor BamB
MSLAVLTLVLLGRAPASDWPRFRGPNGTGISPDAKPTPTQWSDTENLKWKLALPGPGSSSPIIVGDRVFVTCWTGYGLDARDPGDQQNLKRHLICVDRQTGKIAWNKTVAPVLPEDPYEGMFTQHGYASHTPVSDGQRVYAHFGKTGVAAFDLDGNQLWQTSVGTESGAMGWGTASSPIVYKNLVIVTASAESESLVALQKDTGAVVWKKEASGFSSTWGTPALVDVGNDRTDLVLAVPFEIWGFDPESGKLRWYSEGIQSDSICSSVVAHDGVVYAAERGPRGGGTIAVRAGGTDDVTKSHVVWTGNQQSRIGTPVVHEGRIYWVSGGTANCIDAKTGEQVYESRLSSTAAPAAPAPGAAPGPPGGPGRRPGGFRGGFGGQDYSSPVVADGKLYFVSRAGVTSVLALGPEFRLLAQNRFQDGGDFSATPAISDGQLLIRSSKYLYCVAEAP